ncbi:hypothetical protein Pyn_30495 [Prunus yedoensis var. nudiflora]|uniref:Uncharacterized protein n=1 Tax=Prunus yedoensis var. nudiflora TaxID=2094558 RepID=A0A314USJ2_PRUYE|nr:hypothetical protein Pyn_30495 [Prunus yedoensis var. nudiflora]
MEKIKDFKDEKVGDMVVMAAGSLQQPREWVNGHWMLAAVKRKVSEFSWLLRGLQQPRGVGFAWAMPPNV